MRARLERAIWRGALLSVAVATSGCAGKSEYEPEGDGGTAAGGGGAGGSGVTRGGESTIGGTTGGSTTVAGGTSSSGGPNAGLPLYPNDDYPVCAGPEHDGGYSGQCCASPHCYTPADGGACAPASEVGYELLPKFPPGSGSCGCYLPGQEATVAGPYRPRPDGTPVSEGECCYLVGSIGCLGRPLLVGGQARSAPRAPRADWTRRPSFAS
jgi:hypothetical protein